MKWDNRIEQYSATVNSSQKSKPTILNMKRVCSLRKPLLESSWVDHTTIEFAEVRQGSGSHPDNEVLILVAIVLGVVSIQLIDVLVPCRGMGGVHPGCGEICRSVWLFMHEAHRSKELLTGWVLELDILICVPGNPSVVQRKGLISLIAVIHHCEGVCN